MTLFCCEWEDRTSLLVDDVDQASAVEVATEVAEGRAPERVRALAPRFFVAEVGFESEFREDDDGDEVDDDDEEELWCIPLPHVDEALAAIHNGDVPMPVANGAPPEPVITVQGTTVCGEEAEDDSGNVVSCTKDPNHEPPHRAGDLEW